MDTSSRSIVPERSWPGWAGIRAYIAWPRLSRGDERNRVLEASLIINGFWELAGQRRRRMVETQLSMIKAQGGAK